MDTLAQWSELLELIPGYNSFATADPTDYFDPEAAQFAIDFFSECLVLVEGHAAGEPFILSPWQQAITAALWGWKKADGSRRYREAFVYVARKNSKTAFAAGLLCLELFTSNELGGQLYAAAASRDQASHIYRFASEMILRSPEMSSRAKLYKSFKSIEVPRTGTTFRALSHEASTAHGLGPSFVIVDELHAHPNGELLEVLQTGSGARKSPLLIHITTADFNRESVCNHKYDYACKVRDGILEDSSFLPVLFEAPADADWTDPAVWALANPNLGISVQQDYLERECKRAQAEPSYENTFRRLHLNQRTQQDVRWLRIEDWQNCRGLIEESELYGRRCYGALDIGTKLDLTCFALIFPPLTDSDKYTILPRFFMPSDNAREKEKKDRVPYSLWARQGFIELTDGNVIDYEAIRRQILKDSSLFQIEEIAYDPWSATQLSLEMQGEGATMTEVRQGFRSYSEATKELERLVISGKLNHGNNPVLLWQIGNVAIEEDASGNIKPSKKKSTARIDGVAATIMALGRAMANVESVSVYVYRGLITL